VNFLTDIIVQQRVAAAAAAAAALAAAAAASAVPSTAASAMLVSAGPLSFAFSSAAMGASDAGNITTSITPHDNVPGEVELQEVRSGDRGRNNYPDDAGGDRYVHMRGADLCSVVAFAYAIVGSILYASVNLLTLLSSSLPPTTAIMEKILATMPAATLLNSTRATQSPILILLPLAKATLVLVAVIAVVAVIRLQV